LKLFALNSITIVWGFLFLGTVTSWLLAPKENYLDPLIPGLIIILIAFVKVRLILLYFMELRIAPQPWRGLFEVWMATACAIVVFFYFIGT
jgi:heme/copper-type cytochrome/quinol oxidase subunit 4